MLERAAVGVYLVLSAACGSGIHVDDGSQTPPLPAVQSGVFKDGNVSGLTFVSGDESGVTGPAGEFRCETDEPVTFSIGGVTLGRADCSTLAHPPALTASGGFRDIEAVNVSRLLLMLDEDQDPENGIEIPDSLRAVAPTWAQIDFGAADFASELAQIISDIFVIEGRLVGTPPTPTEALAHMEPQLACAYSGVFVGSLPAPDIEDVGTLAVIVFPGASDTTGRFSLQAFRPGRYLLFLNLTGQVGFATRPTLTTGRRDPQPSASGRFVTPDRITGSWRNPLPSGSLEAELLNSGATFSAGRIGASTGRYRFVGEISGPDGYGALALTLDGTSLSGKAFGLAAGDIRTVSGVAAADDSIELSLEGAAATTTVRLARDGAGRPSVIAGDWPAGPRDSFTAYGCRLN